MTKYPMSKEWCIEKAKLEDGAEIGAGALGFCAHKVVGHLPVRDAETGLTRDEWRCADCGSHFAPAATIAKQAERIEVESDRSDRFAAALSQVRADIMKGATNVIWTGVPPNETVVDYVTRTLGDNFDHDEVYDTDSEGG